jgi:hypothetical protein
LNRGSGSLQTFDSIVRGGALAPLGMARFADVLSPDNVRDLHAFIVDEAWHAYDQQTR